LNVYKIIRRKISRKYSGKTGKIGKSRKYRVIKIKYREISIKNGNNIGKLSRKW
jgi:hypothetical protein